MKTRYEIFVTLYVTLSGILKPTLKFLHISYCRNKPSADVYSFIVYVLSCCYIIKHFDMFYTHLEQNNNFELPVMVHRTVIFFFCRFGEQNYCQSLIFVDKAHLWWCWELYLLYRIPSGLLKKYHSTTAYWLVVHFIMPNFSESERLLGRHEVTWCCLSQLSHSWLVPVVWMGLSCIDQVKNKLKHCDCLEIQVQSVRTLSTEWSYI